jgi:hypothetical protein
MYLTLVVIPWDMFYIWISSAAHVLCFGLRLKSVKSCFTDQSAQWQFFLKDQLG